MAKRISPEDEKVLADCLKHEAQASQPAFSEALHARICRALKQSEAQPSRDSGILPSPRRWAYAAIAATCLVGGLLVAWGLSNMFWPEPLPPDVESVVVVPPQASEPLPELDALTGVTGRTADQVGMLVDSTLTTQQWAYFQHDARIAAGLLIDQLPLDIASAAEP